MRTQHKHTRKPEVGWTNKGFHMTLLLSLILLFFALAGVNKISEDLFGSKSALVHAQESEIINPLPSNSPTPPPTSRPDPVAQSKWEEFVLAAKKVSKIYNFPVNVVLAQGALESGRGSSNFCKERNNCLGIGAVDWDPNQAFVYENMEQSVVEYMRIIRKNFPEAWEHRTDADVVIYHLKYNKEGLVYATDPIYVEKVKSMPEWGEK